MIFDQADSAIDWDEMTRPEGYYLWDEDLAAAANVAINLGKPLLLTGEPGVGKSEFSRYLASQLNAGKGLKHFKFVVKSTSEARDLFYHYDALARFHDAQISAAALAPLNSAVEAHPNGSNQALRYLSYNALGQAFLQTLGKQTAVQKGFIDEQMSSRFSADFATQKSRSVVLIDEIDKAPRDVPNDILDEIDKMAFEVREIGNRRIEADKALRPVVVITSNSERDLPEPFLRRCVYYHIAFPADESILEKIVLSRLGGPIRPLMGEAQALYLVLRQQEYGLQKKPGLAEYLDWLYILTQDAQNLDRSLQQSDLSSAQTTLMKHAQDQQILQKKWADWLQQIQRKDSST